MILIVVFAVFIFLIYQLYENFFPAPNIDPRDKYVLISGCDSGFGQALAIELDRQGFHVLAGVLSTTSIEQLKNQLSSQATIFQLDVTRKEHIDAAYKLIQSKTDTLHALVNNAGVSTGGHIDWITTESMRQVMDINFFGHVDMTKTFLPMLIKKKDSRVVNITSVAGILSPPSSSVYCASKYALESFSDCLRREMFSWNLRVSIIEPGIMRTPIVQKYAAASNDVFTNIPADVRQRWGEEFFKYHFDKIKNNVLLRFAEDPNKVVRALQHAVASTSPCIRYRPGWQSKFIYYPLSMIPAWIADIYFAKSRALPVLPAGVYKQKSA